MENTFHISSYSHMCDNSIASVFDALEKSKCHFLNCYTKNCLTYWTITGLLVVIQFEKSNKTLS